jgi:membrane protease YdiL (CAAX protease family)
MVATSALFAAYHPLPFAAFVSAIIFVVVYRRTGSIWACILVHGLSNALQSPALLGRFHMPTAGKETGEIALWAPHLSVLVLVLALIGIYTWTARESSEPEEPETEIRCA